MQLTRRRCHGIFRRVTGVPGNSERDGMMRTVGDHEPAYRMHEFLD